MSPGCKLSDVGKFFYQIDEKQYCTICSNNCVKPATETSKQLLNNSEKRRCECDHTGTVYFLFLGGFIIPMVDRF